MELGWSFFILKRWNHALIDTICHALAASLCKKTFLPFVVLEECEHCLRPVFYKPKLQLYKEGS